MRVLCWFSCGSASAVAAKFAYEMLGDSVEIIYCDTLAHEHPDNLRFLKDVEKWIGKPIKILKSKKYSDIYDVFEKTKYLVGPQGARCTVELKKRVRMEYQNPNDTHVFGFTFEENKRILRFKEQNFESAYFPLFDNKITKQMCHDIIAQAGIEQPAMYRLGYKNNNCIGCVKGGAGYWNQIRKDFPANFNRMAAVERKLGISINKIRRNGKMTKVFLDELSPDAGRNQKQDDIECGVICKQPR